MVNDLLGSIRSRGNYLSALGLIAYSEICGRQWFFNGNSNEENWKCFNEFIKFIDLEELLEKQLIHKEKPIKFYDAIRNGLVHEYFLKVKEGAVSMIPKDEEQKKYGFSIHPPDRVILIVISYFNLFCSGLRKAKRLKKI